MHERTGGNPFFLEEICQALLEEGTLKVQDRRVAMIDSLNTLDLPDTVQAVIRTRIDRLDRDTREVEWTRGDFQSALCNYQAALDLFRTVGDVPSMD